MLLLASALLGSGVAACGSAGKATDSASVASSATATTGTTPTTTTTASNTTVSQPGVKTDRDGDTDNNDDDYRYGHAASAADKRAVTALVKRYYTLAAAGDGASACSLIFPPFAEEIPEIYGESLGPPALRGTTCAEVMTKFFKQEHRKLLVDIVKLEVTDVRIRGNRALALLNFKAMPPRDIRVHRELGAWKIDELLDKGVA